MRLMALALCRCTTAMAIEPMAIRPDGSNRTDMGSAVVNGRPRCTASPRPPTGRGQHVDPDTPPGAVRPSGLVVLDGLSVQPAIWAHSVTSARVPHNDP